MSHTLAPEKSREQTTLKAKVFDVMERIIGQHPPTCPWRVMYSPIVREVIAALPHEETGNLSVGIGADPPAILVDAIGVYKEALGCVRADDAKLAAEKAKKRR